MIFIWGQRLYGKCNHAKGIFYVSTKFFHLWYLPIIPLESWLILEGSEDGDGWQGCSLPLSFKSILLGYLRPWLILLGVLGAGFGFSKYNFDPVGSMLTGAAGVAAIAFAIATYYLFKPGQDQVVELMQQAGFDEEDIQGLMTSSENGTLDEERLHAGGRFTSTGV